MCVCARENEIERVCECTRVSAREMESARACERERVCVCAHVKEGQRREIRVLREFELAKVSSSPSSFEAKHFQFEGSIVRRKTSVVHVLNIFFRQTFSSTLSCIFV